jgi:uncharacterized protein YecE (DUF72 family)
VSAVYVYFNNDPGGEAVKNALTLKEFFLAKAQRRKEEAG